MARAFPTTKTRVLYVNFELPRESALRRVELVSRALGLETAPQDLDIWNLRGYSADASVILPKIVEFAADKGFGLIIIDPIYKILGPRDENSARDMADLMREIEQLAIKTNASVTFAAHFAKGNAALKEAIDRASGSGVTARDPDSIVTMTKHQEDDAFTVELILRNLPPQESFVVRRSTP